MLQHHIADNAFVIIIVLSRSYNALLWWWRNNVTILSWFDPIATKCKSLNAHYAFSQNANLDPILYYWGGRKVRGSSGRRKEGK